MQLFEMILKIITAFCSVCLFGMMAYQLYLTVFGFRRETLDYQPHDPESRFLILVPAHNEEKVIGDIIRNLKEMDYPEEMYDFYIIADNCTDQTADRARELGAKVIVTQKEGPDAPTGKPIALKKALEALGDYPEKYDLVMIFDADNQMDRNMLREVNSQYLDCGRPDFIQCYLGAKNKEGLVAWFYYTSYILTNRFFQLAKHRRHLNCSLGGTGFSISTAYLKQRGGWTTMSLTEDFEMQVEATLQGKKILWNHNTRIYDEKPTKLRASIRQKLRWGQGHWFVALRNTGKLFGALFSKTISFREFLSLFTYMYSLSAYVLTALQLLVSVIWAIHAGGMTLGFSQSPLSILSGLALFTYCYFFLFYYADWVDNRIPFRLNTLPRMIVSYVLNIVVGTFNQIGGLMLHRRQNHWVKTDHSLHGDMEQKPVGGNEKEANAPEVARKNG